MRWVVHRHKWALDIDGHLFGDESVLGTMLFKTKREAQQFVNAHAWEIKPRVVKVVAYFVELKIERFDG